MLITKEFVQLSRNAADWRGDRERIMQYPANKRDEKGHQMAEHEHGTMDSKVQEQTFVGFIKVSSYVATVSVVLLIFIGLVNG